MLASISKSNLLIVLLAVLLITVIALWKQNSALKQQIDTQKQTSLILTATGTDNVAAQALNNEQELKLLQDQLKQLINLKNQLEN